MDNNVVINDEKYTIPIDDIKKIKELLNEPELYKKHKILHSPVLDGTIHNISFIGDKKIKIECNNLWYWVEEDSFNECKEDNKEDIKYTKLVVDTINTIQDILYENNIDFYILDDEVE